MAAAKARKKSGGGSMSWLQGLACGGILAFATASALLFGVLLMPAGIAFIIDREPRHPVARAMFLAGTAFALDPLWRLWMAGDTMNAAMQLLIDPAVLCPPWVACAAGWGLCEILPVILRAISEVHARKQVAALLKEEAELRKEWDLET